LNQTAVQSSLLSDQVELDARDGNGSTALILVAYHGHIDALNLLLQAGADRNVGDNRGNTALMGATFRGEEQIARALLAHPRTDPDARNNAGQNAAMFAALFGRAAALDALASRGTDLGAADPSGQTPESLARQQGNEALAGSIAKA